jgi:hypothetical protein
LIPPGTKFNDRWNQLDVGVKKSFRIRGWRMEGSAMVFNALNFSPILTFNNAYGSSLDTPLSNLQPRLLRLIALRIVDPMPRAGRAHRPGRRASRGAIELLDRTPSCFGVRDEPALKPCGEFLPSVHASFRLTIGIRHGHNVEFPYSVLFAVVSLVFAGLYIIQPRAEKVGSIASAL